VRWLTAEPILTRNREEPTEMHGSDRGRERDIWWWAAFVVVLTIANSSSARAQPITDPDLQGRIVQRSDGALFLYKDGFKFPIQLADVDDDFINSLPDGDAPIGQLDPVLPLGPPPPADVPAPAPVEGPPVPVVVPGPYLAVANPAPGDNLAIGGLDIRGKAFDPIASVDQGSGIDRVQIFLEDRDRGGLHLGDARLGLPNTAAAPDSQFALAGWDVVVNLPSGVHTLFIYARSAVTGKETLLQVPVRVGTGG
jgi:hypothetical protein